MTEQKKSRTKKIVNIVLWVFLAIALVMTIFAFTAQASSSGMPQIGGKCFMFVKSNSMNEKGGFKKGDLIICKTLTDEEKRSLKEGDVITFLVDLTNDGLDNKELNTHRIIDINEGEDGLALSYVTKGDHNDYQDGHEVYYTEVEAQWTGKRIPLLGAIIGFLQSQVGFFVCIVLPLLASLIYELMLLIKTVNHLRGKDKREISAEEEEEIKKRAVEEYLREQAAKQAAETPKDGESKQ